MLAIGDEAPPFELQDQSATMVRSSDFQGEWWLIYWYPKADTPGCAAQAQGVRDNLELFGVLGCRVVGASFDDVDALAAFSSRYNLGFPLLSDPDRIAGRAYGVVSASEPTSGALRIAYLVEPSGRIGRTYLVDDPARFADLVLDDLEGEMR